LHAELLEPRHMLSGDSIVEPLAAFAVDDVGPSSMVVGSQNLILASAALSDYDYQSVITPVAEQLTLPDGVDLSSRLEFQAWLAAEAQHRFGHLFGQSVESIEDYPSDWELSYPWLIDIDFGWRSFSTINDSIQTSATAGLDTTNVQVAGVDEADLVETDGEFLYIASGRVLTIVDIRDAGNVRTSARYEFDNNIGQLYLDGDRLVTVTGTLPPRFISGFEIQLQTRQHQTTVSVLDITSREQPELISQSTFDGDIVSSRLVDGQLRLVMSHRMQSSLQLNRPRIVGHFDAETQTSSFSFETRQAYMARAVDDYLANLLPGYQQFSAAEASTQRHDMMELGEWLESRDNQAGLSNYNSIATIDIGTGQVLDTLVLPTPEASANAITGIVFIGTTRLSASTTVYSSSDHLYLLTDQLDGTTSIQQFSFDSDGHITASTTTAIEGTIPNQFAVDEYQGMLRVVTRDATATRLTILNATDNKLTFVSELTDLAPGEQLQSVRFEKEEVYILTWQQIVTPTRVIPYDPLLVIDLADPTDPTLLGELEIPGYSEYMHTIDNDHVWALGTTGTQQLELSVFNIADRSLPTREFHFVFSPGMRTTSTATGTVATRDLDHHAITYHAETGLVAVPVSQQMMRGGWGGMIKNTLEVVRVDPTTGIQQLASIEHSTPIVRSMVVGQTLVAISANEVSVHDLSDPSIELSRQNFVQQPTTAIPVASPRPVAPGKVDDSKLAGGNLVGLIDNFDKYAAEMPTKSVVDEQPLAVSESKWESLVDASLAERLDFGDAIVNRPTKQSVPKPADDSATATKVAHDLRVDLSGLR
jgi:uncharacterized secreted protein with C-terminal beta-propeller domain